LGIQTKSSVGPDKVRENLLTPTNSHFHLTSLRVEWEKNPDVDLFRCNPKSKQVKGRLGAKSTMEVGHIFVVGFVPWSWYKQVLHEIGIFFLSRVACSALLGGLFLAKHIVVTGETVKTTDNKHVCKRDTPLHLYIMFIVGIGCSSLRHTVQ